MQWGVNGLATVGSNSSLVSSGRAVRIFTVATAASGGTISLYNTATSTTANFVLTVGKGSQLVEDFANGIRFPNGCFAVAIGQTAMVSYAEEF